MSRKAPPGHPRLSHFSSHCFLAWHHPHARHQPSLALHNDGLGHRSGTASSPITIMPYTIIRYIVPQVLRGVLFPEVHVNGFKKKKKKKKKQHKNSKKKKNNKKQKKMKTKKKNK